MGYYLYDNLLDDNTGLFAGATDTNLGTIALLGGLGGGLGGGYGQHGGYYPAPAYGAHPAPAQGGRKRRGGGEGRRKKKARILTEGSVVLAPVSTAARIPMTQPAMNASVETLVMEMLLSVKRIGSDVKLKSIAVKTPVPQPVKIGSVETPKIVMEKTSARLRGGDVKLKPKPVLFAG